MRAYPEASVKAPKSAFVWAVALLVFSCIGFVFLFLEKTHFEIKGALGLIIQPALYFLIVLGAYAALLIRASRMPFAIIHFRWLLLFSIHTLVVAVVYRIAGGISIPTAFIYLLLLFASPAIHANGRFILGVAGVAIAINAAYSVMQSLSVVGIISTYDLPIIPLAFSDSEGLATFDIRRASGLYFQPLAAGSIFGLASLTFWKLHQRTGNRFFRIVHYLSLIGLLLSQSWAATGLALLFYLWLGRWPLRLGAALLAACAMAYAASRPDLIQMAADIYASKMDNSGMTKIGLVFMHMEYFSSNPLSLIAGGVFDVGTPYTENTFINMCYLYGVLPTLALPSIVLVHSLRNIRLCRLAAYPRPAEAEAARHLNLVALFPFVLMFFQNSALVPPVLVLLVLLLSWNRHDPESIGT